MQHIANMDNRSLICSGHRVPANCMSAADLEWAGKTSSKGTSVIVLSPSGYYYHTEISDSERRAHQRFRANFWKPDTGHHN